MHNHSEKIQPKKLAITVVLAILLLGYAYMTRTNRGYDASKQELVATSTPSINQ